MIKDPLKLEMPMPIVTSRIQIKPRKLEDSEMVFNAILESLPQLQPWMPWAQIAPDLDEIKKSCSKAEENFRQRTDFTFSIFNQDGSQFIGAIGLQDPRWDIPSFNMAYWINKNFRGHGFITEAVNALSRYAFEVMMARRIEIHCATENNPSLNLIKKLGFSQEGILRNYEVAPNGSLRHIVVSARYSLDDLPTLQVKW